MAWLYRFRASLDICLKWRKLPFAQKNVGRQLPDEWCCAMHPESDFNRFVLLEFVWPDIDEKLVRIL